MIENYATNSKKRWQFEIQIRSFRFLLICFLNLLYNSIENEPTQRQLQTNEWRPGVANLSGKRYFSSRINITLDMMTLCIIWVPFTYRLACQRCEQGREERQIISTWIQFHYGNSNIKQKKANNKHTQKAN